MLIHFRMHSVCVLSHSLDLPLSPEAESLVVGHSLEELATRGDLHEHVQVLRAVSE
jgi:hypothetical protein